MEFNQSQAIYLQIADFVCDRIHLGELKPEDKVPSVRELAVTLEVNPNTVMRSYEHLQQQGVIYTRRGLGYYISADAPGKLINLRRDQFLHEELPAFFHKMFLLGIELDELKVRYDAFRKSRQQ
jgi:GntR family transcriptional regulator